eukprot:187391-Prymnesium_polylepis.1
MVNERLEEVRDVLWLQVHDARAPEHLALVDHQLQCIPHALPLVVLSAGQPESLGHLQPLFLRCKLRYVLEPSLQVGLEGIEFHVWCVECLGCPDRITPIAQSSKCFVRQTPQLWNGLANDREERWLREDKLLNGNAEVLKGFVATLKRADA